MALLNQGQVSRQAEIVAKEILQNTPSQSIRIFANTSRIIPAAYLIRQYLPDAGVNDGPLGANVVLIDPRCDSVTIENIRNNQPHAYITTFCDPSDTFPWDTSSKLHRYSEETLVTDLLQYIGEDANREGLTETPTRFLKAWEHFSRGYKEDPKTILKSFKDGSADYDEMVFVGNIPVFSKCEHHMADIIGRAYVGYIPSGKIVGLSKLARVVDCFARRLQVQERLTVQIADALVEHVKPQGVGVMLKCRHMCMESRGVQAIGSVTTTSALRGDLRHEDSARAEFLALVADCTTGMNV